MGKIMSSWAGKGTDLHPPQLEATPRDERIQQGRELYGGNGVYSPAVGGRGQFREGKGFSEKGVEQERKANAMNQVILPPHDNPLPAPAASKPAQPTVPRISRTPSREATQVCNKAENSVPMDSASAVSPVSRQSQNTVPPVSRQSQNKTPPDIPRTTSRREVAPRNDLGGTIVGFIVVPNHLMLVPRSINQPSEKADMEKMVEQLRNQREAQEFLRSSRRMKTNDMLADNPYDLVSNEAATATGAQPTGQAATNVTLARQQERRLPFDELKTPNNTYLGTSNQASAKDSTTGAPPTGQAAANQNYNRESPSRAEVKSNNCCCCVM